MSVKNQVQLITYPDSLGGDLKSLQYVLQKYFHDEIKGVHILPPFPSSGDRGFAPLTYFEIDSKFGSWDDIKAMGDKFDIVIDLMVNHISKQSDYFQDFLKKGRKSKFADMFITLDKLWNDGKPKDKDIQKMFLRRTRPYSTYRIEETGEEETVWTTFGKTDPSEQIDIDVGTKAVKQLLTDIFNNFHNQNINVVRLDAIGYVIKQMGTSCFFVEPEIYEFLNWIKELADSLEIELLPELHSHYSSQNKLAAQGFWIYDFILPYSILDAIINKTGINLCAYLKERPHKQFTMLDCHDGIPVKPDLDDLIETTRARQLVDLCVERGSNLSLILSDQHKGKDNFDVHQIRCTYYSVLNNDDNAYLTARAIQFFTPGIPQVYYVGLLAGENDTERAELLGDGREINRHNYTLEDIEISFQRNVVQRLLRLIRFRNEHPAFHGVFEVLDCPQNEVRLSWKSETSQCTLFVSLEDGKSVIVYSDKEGKDIRYEV